MNSYYRMTNPVDLTPTELAELTTVHCICPCRAEQRGSMAELRRQGWAFDVGEYGEDLCPSCSPYVKRAAESYSGRYVYAEAK
jgi:hypothetical protein